MTREEARNLLGEGASDTQVTELLNKFHSETKSYQEKINSLEESNKKSEATINELSGYKDELDSIKKSNMTEQEKIEAKLKEANAILHNAKIKSNTATIRNILAGENIDEKLFSSLVDEDEQVSIDRANMFKSVLTSQREAVEKKVREELNSIPVEPNLSNKKQSDNVVDLDKFLNMTASEQQAFATNNPNEYNSLMNN